MIRPLALALIAKRLRSFLDKAGNGGLVDPQVDRPVCDEAYHQIVGENAGATEHAPNPHGPE